MSFLLFNIGLLMLARYFDKKRFRLGYGGGYYDRYIDKFENKKKIFTIGLAYSFQCVEKLPVENFDKNLNCIITNKKIYK